MLTRHVLYLHLGAAHSAWLSTAKQIHKKTHGSVPCSRAPWEYLLWEGRGFLRSQQTSSVAILHSPRRRGAGHNWIMIRKSEMSALRRWTIYLHVKIAKIFSFLREIPYCGCLFVSLRGSTINQVSLPLPICLYLKDITQFNLVELWQLDILRTHTRPPTHEHISEHWQKMYSEARSTWENNHSEFMTVCWIVKIWTLWILKCYFWYVSLPTDL